MSSINSATLLCRLPLRVEIDSGHREAEAIAASKFPCIEVVSGRRRLHGDAASRLLSEEDEGKAMNADRRAGWHVPHHLFPCNSIHPPCQCMNNLQKHMLVQRCSKKITEVTKCPFLDWVDAKVRGGVALFLFLFFYQER